MPPSVKCVAILGLGNMGRAYAHRLAAAGLDVNVWNRTHSTAEQTANDIRKELSKSGSTAGSVVVHSTCVNAIAAAAVILCATTNFSALRAVTIEHPDRTTRLAIKTLLSSGVSKDSNAKENPKRRTFVALCSGTPSEARAFAGDFAAAVSSGALLVDACYGGSPAAVRGGTGSMFVGLPPDTASAGGISNPSHEVEAAAQKRGGPLPKLLGPLAPAVPPDVAVVFDLLAASVCVQTVGANRVLDYAVVDAHLAAATVFATSLPLLAAEGCPPEYLALYAAHRLGGARSTFEHLTRVYNDAAAASGLPSGGGGGRAMSGGWSREQREAVCKALSEHNVVGVRVASDYFLRRVQWLDTLGPAAAGSRRITTALGDLLGAAATAYGPQADIAAVGCPL
eukprot:TRINITY_DN69934_c0_g1_i1.p1 TRINITY_DN69934_c0_g1~~TRINITY_DN69934_c0_g1_i1.p1  ORF type:complete len:396 (-),score=72.25 TRINITY_DN69934_c0_g1_i1:435-1622(-)